MITTIYGDMDERFLTPDHSTVDNENEHTEVIQYRLAGEVVHRSVHVRLKKQLGIELALGRFL